MRISFMFFPESLSDNSLIDKFIVSGDLDLFDTFHAID